MTEKTEWEVVDAPAPNTRQTIRHLMKSLLGPWWKWKIACAATIAGLALAFFAMLTGMFMLLILIGAITSIGIGKFKHWLRRGHRSVSL